MEDLREVGRIGIDDTPASGGRQPPVSFSSNRGLTSPARRECPGSHATMRTGSHLALTLEILAAMVPPLSVPNLSEIDGVGFPGRRSAAGEPFLAGRRSTRRRG